MRGPRWPERRRFDPAVVRRYMGEDGDVVVGLAEAVKHWPKMPWRLLATCLWDGRPPQELMGDMDQGLAWWLRMRKETNSRVCPHCSASFLHPRIRRPLRGRPYEVCPYCGAKLTKGGE